MNQANLFPFEQTNKQNTHTHTHTHKLSKVSLHFWDRKSQDPENGLQNPKLLGSHKPLWFIWLFSLFTPSVHTVLVAPECTRHVLAIVSLWEEISESSPPHFSLSYAHPPTLPLSPNATLYKHTPVHTHTQDQPCEDTVRRQLSTIQAESSHQELNQLEPCSALQVSVSAD